MISSACRKTRILRTESCAAMRIKLRPSLGRPFGSATVGEFCAPVVPQVGVNHLVTIRFMRTPLLIRLAKSSMRLSTIDLYDLLRNEMSRIHFCGHLVGSTKMIIHPIEKHLVIDPPLIYTISIYRYWRLRWAKTESPNCPAMGAVKPFGCRKSFASKEIESAFGESITASY